MPAGELTIAYRGMTAFEPPTDDCTGRLIEDALQDASTLDLYGDHYNDKCIKDGAGPNHNSPKANMGVTFLNGDDAWKDDISEIQGAPYYQVRVTFQADIFSGLVPELSAFALSWHE